MDTDQYAQHTYEVPPPSSPSVEPQGEQDINVNCSDEGPVSKGHSETSLAQSAVMVAKGGRPPKKLANRFASLDAEQTKKAFSDLNEEIEKKSDAAESALEGARYKLAELVPKIAEMQSLLSQRGEKRRVVLMQAGLPTWTKWYGSFKEQHGLRLSLRGIQKRLAKLRDRKSDGTDATPKTKQRAVNTVGAKPQCKEGHGAAKAKVEKQLSATKERHTELRKRIASLENENHKLARKVQQLQTGDGKATPRLVSQREVLMEIADLSMQAFEIVNGNLGDRLMASAEGKRVIDIAKKVIAMKGKLKIH